MIDMADVLMESVGCEVGVVPSTSSSIIYLSRGPGEKGNLGVSCAHPDGWSNTTRWPMDC